MSRRNQHERRAGFTLMEVMLVLVILVILGSLAVGTFTGARKNANIKAAESQISLFETPLKMYNMNIGDYPTTDQSLTALNTAPSDLPDPSKWTMTMDDKIPTDPWGNAYQYQYPPTHNSEKPDIWSFGPDGQNATEDDLTNW